MFTHKPSRLTMILAGVPGLLMVVFALFIPEWSILLMIMGFSLLIIALLTAQFMFAWHMLKEDEKDRQANMTTCPNCGNPIYTDDTVCPYCHEEVEK